MKISKEDFEAYEEVRNSGRINMLDVGVVSTLSGLDTYKIKYIIHNYDELMKQYPGVRIEA